MKKREREKNTGQFNYRILKIWMFFISFCYGDGHPQVFIAATSSNLHLQLHVHFFFDREFHQKGAIWRGTSSHFLLQISHSIPPSLVIHTESKCIKMYALRKLAFLYFWPFVFFVLTHVLWKKRIKARIKKKVNSNKVLQFYKSWRNRT